LPAGTPTTRPAAPSSSQAAVEAMVRDDAKPLASASMTNQADVATAKPAALTANTNAVAMPMPAVGTFYIQLGAYSQADRAESIRTQLQQQWASLPSIEIAQSSALYRLFCGPFNTREEAAAAAQKLQGSGTTKVLVVQR
ncbi:MAG: SPOR domain-containing protein, partial [Burkholderiaceae bacterium]